MFCHICGTQIEEGSMFCHECGTKVVYEQEADTERNSKANTRLSLGKPAKIISLISAAAIILVLVKSSILKNALDTLSGINRETENQVTGATTVQDMQSYNDSGDGMQGYDELAESYYGQSQKLDSALVGRWRSYDGGTLEFSDSGVIVSCDFQCSSLRLQKPDLIYWEASNGRVTCTAYFYNDIKYRIFKQYEGEKDEREIINIGGGDSDYYRLSGTYGDIVGMWVSVWGEVWSYQFNEDGTGMWNDRYPITWYTYTTENGTNILNYTLTDITYFDYSIAGDMLTVFLSDSSRIYTKVSSD